MAGESYLKNTLTTFAVLFLLAQVTFGALPGYEFIDLGTLGGFYSCAYSINSSGQIVGMAANSSNCVRATLFDPTGSGNNIDLGTIGGCCGVARSINDRGQIVGWSSDSSTGWSKATLFDPTGNGDNVDLGSLGVGLSGAYSVNNNGHIVGYAFNSSSYSERATLFDPTGNGENIDLSTPDGSWSEVAYSINDKAQIVGKAQKSADYVCATLFDPNGSGNNIDLGTLGGSHSAAHSINDTGQIVGIAENSSGYDHATLFDPSGNADNTDLGILDVVSVSTTSLMKRNAQITHSPDSIDVIIVRPELPKYPATKAFCINDNGQIVGYYREALAPYKATLFDPTGNSNNLDLNTLLIDPNCGWTLEYAYSINNSGWIVGQGMNPAGEHHAYLLIPILPKIIYVDDDATGANNGSSWPDAFNYLQDALAAANDGDEIRVAQGIYKPDQGAVVTTGDRKATFQLINGVTIKGGYAGFGQPDPDARDINLYETILTGDLAGDDGQNFSNNGENSYQVVTAISVGSTAVLDGLIITAGNANHPHYLSMKISGGGMYMLYSSPKIIDCIFTSNSAAYGGAGLYNYKGDSVLTNCTFHSNLATSHPHYGGSGYGAGMYNSTGSPILTECTFSNNHAKGRYPEDFGGIGGGLFCYVRTMNDIDKGPTLIDCIFNDNTAQSAAGGMCPGIGNTILINCIFTRNYAEDGGAMATAPRMMVNCLLFANSAEYGGAMYLCEDKNNLIINCTFVANSAAFIGGIVDCEDSIANLTNCILFNNTTSGVADEQAQIYLPDGTPVLKYNCIQGWTGDLGGTGNIGDLPLFVDQNNHDYHLLPGSPCIDAGDPNYIEEHNETDLDGKPRVMGGRIDMGAYEYGQLVPAEARIVPQTINLASKGNWITCYIWLPDEYDVADIEPNSIFLESQIQPEQFSVDEQQQVATARFTREDVHTILEVGDIELTITGQLTDRTVFEGADTIKIIDKTGKN